MSLKSAPYYWAECDAEECEKSSREIGEYSAWAQADVVEMDIENADWIVIGDKHYCDDCRAQFDCDECGELKTECTCEESTEEEVTP